MLQPPAQETLKVLLSAKIRSRPPCQTRHTYACWNLMARGNLAFIANQMGHKDRSMLANVYHGWINSQPPREWGISVRA